MSIGMIALIVLSILILFGVLQRVLDRMRLTDRQALFWAACIIVGTLIPSIPLGQNVSVNIGGAIVPAILSVYLFVKAGTAKERIRALLATLFTGAAVFLLGRYLPNEPEAMILDPMWLYALAGGIVACLLGNSSRSAFIGGSMGVLLADIVQAFLNRNAGAQATRLSLGGAGALDTVVITAIWAVVLTELISLIKGRFSKNERRDEYGYKDLAYERAHREGRVSEDEAQHAGNHDYRTGSHGYSDVRVQTNEIRHDHNHASSDEDEVQYRDEFEYHNEEPRREPIGDDEEGDI